MRQERDYALGWEFRSVRDPQYKSKLTVDLEEQRGNFKKIPVHTGELFGCV
jgi:hypothetical protein